MKLFFLLFLFIAISLHAQQSIKVKREDNRFLFYQTGHKNDTITSYKNDVFFMKLPDSLQHVIQIHIENGQFIKTKNSSLYRLIPVPGMKYSHSKQDTIFTTLLEGNTNPSKTITVTFIETIQRKTILKNTFLSR